MRDSHRVELAMKPRNRPYGEGGSSGLEIDVLDHSAEKALSSSLSQPSKAILTWEAKLATILQDYLQPDYRGSLELVADSVLGLLPSKTSYTTEMFAFAELCVEITEQIPYYHPSQMKLVRLLVYFARSPKFVSHANIQVGFYSETLWLFPIANGCREDETFIIVIKFLGKSRDNLRGV
jgi:hypothetical protein